MEGVQREDEGYERARASSAGGAGQEQEQQHRRGGVYEYADEMVPTGVHAEELHVQHMREARQGKPIGGFGGSESPEGAIRSDALPHVRIIGYVIRVVVIQERKLARLRVDGEGGRQQEEADPQVRA